MGSLQFEIYNGNKLIRTLKQKVPKKNGLHYITWYMYEKGVARPSRKINKPKREPSGVKAKPGNYLVKVIYGDQSDTQSITVAKDPRLTISDQAINDKYSNSKLLESYQAVIANATKQLVESKNIAKEYETKLTKKDKKEYKLAIEESKNILKKIDTLMTIYLG